MKTLSKSVESKRKTKGRVSPIWAGIIVVLLLYGLLALINNLPDPLIPFLFAVYWGLLCLPLFFHRPFDWFAPPIFTFWWGLQGIVRPITWMSEGTIDVRLPTTEQENLMLLKWVLVANIMATTMYLFSFYETRHVAWAQRLCQNIGQNLPSRWRTTRLFVLFSFTLPAAVFCYFYILTATGIDSLWELFSAWRSKQTLLEGKFYPFTGLSLFALVVLALSAHQWHQRGTSSPRWITFVGLVTYSIAIALFGLRGYVVRVWIMAAGLYHYIVRSLPIRTVFALLCAVFLFALVSYQVRRAAFKGMIGEGTLPQVTISVEAVSQLVEEDLATRGLDNQIIAFYVFPEYIPFQWGKSWLALLALPIPRFLWPEKPVMTPGGLVRDQFFGGGGSLPLGYLGDLYANFHLMGILFGYWLLGLYHRTLYEWHRRHKNNLSVNFLYVVFLVNLKDFSPLSIIHAVIYCLPAVLLVKFVGGK